MRHIQRIYAIRGRTPVARAVLYRTEATFVGNVD